MAFTVQMLIDALLEDRAPKDAIVFVEIGDEVKAADKLAIVKTDEFMVLAIRSTDKTVVM
jgi:hypothetical protein